MFAVPPAVSVSAEDNVYASGATSKVSGVFQKCATGTRQACVVDGDTIWLSGQNIRVADIDTPEVSEPKCSSELVLGKLAMDRMLELINEGSFDLKGWPARDTDHYGRKLRVLVRDGRSLGDVMVSEGLARTWSGRREPWC
ncbi:thermonuclease family protein [Rhizobium sp. R86522]|uniref:thermonuclease family protein n=1 Tax=Rhizobium sp. R86522 TaxID=3093861 RepID=UPI00366BAD9D